MYRQYENPNKLERQLAELEAELETRIESNEDLDDLIDLQIEIEELEQRINFAWQDDEADEFEFGF